jgi:hypothetical protein
MMRPNVIETQEHTGDFKEYKVTRQLIGTQGLGCQVERGLRSLSDCQLCLPLLIFRENRSWGGTGIYFFSLIINGT